MRLLQYVLRCLVIVRGRLQHSLLQHANRLARDVGLRLLEDVGSLLSARHLQVLVVLRYVCHRVRGLSRDELPNSTALAASFALMSVSIETINFLAVSLG